MGSDIIGRETYSLNDINPCRVVDSCRDHLYFLVFDEKSNALVQATK